jgi:drug/metabolite transporter (DMT)-like permease
MQVSKPLSIQKAYLLLLTAQVAIGAAAIFARFALTGTGPVTVSALRLTLAAIPLWIGAVWQRNQFFPDSRKIQWKSEVGLAIAGLALGLHFVTWITSLKYISVALSTLLVCSTPLWNALYEKWILKRKLKSVFWFALFVAMVGLILVTGEIKLEGSNSLLGAGLALLGSFLIGFYLIVIERVGSSKSSDSVDSAYSTRQMITRTYSWAALSLIMMCGFLQEPFPSFQNRMAWGGILGMAFVSQSLGHTILNNSVKVFSPSIVALATLLEPVLAAILAMVIFSESLSEQTLLGGVLILGALMALLLGYKKTQD